MVGESDVSRLAIRFLQQSEDCAELDSPMYADLLAMLAEDVGAGGPTADLLVGHEDARRDSALPLRLLGGVHRLVLERRAPQLALYYPSVGGTASPSGTGRCRASSRAR